MPTTGAFRLTIFVAAALAVATSSGCAPTPSPTRSAGPSVSVPPSERPSPAAARIVARIPTAPIDLAPAADGVWYVATEGGEGFVGLATEDGVVRDAKVGHLPAAVAATTDAVFVAEGLSDSGQDPRQNRIERLDPETLDPLAWTDILSPTDVIAAEDAVWAVGVRGVLVELDPVTLAVRRTFDLAGRGPARLLSAGGAIWVVNGTTEPPAYLLHRVDPPTGTDDLTELPGGGSFGILASGTNSVWVGTIGAGAGLGRLIEVGFDGTPGAVLTIPAPVGLVARDDVVWWASHDGRVGAVDVATGAVGEPVQAGTSGGCLIEAGGGRLWACEDELVVLETPR